METGNEIHAAEQIIAFLREADVKLSLGRNVGIAFPKDGHHKSPKCFNQSNQHWLLQTVIFNACLLSISLTSR